MLNERRKNRRFDTSLVVEFKALKKSLNSYLGITRDFSCDGFSFDSQSSWIEPGDDLELTFKNPQNGSYFSGLGEIVWKKQANNFEFITGIKFKNVDTAIKRKILEMAAAAGDVSGDQVLCDKRRNRSRIRKKPVYQYAAIIIVSLSLLVLWAVAPLITGKKESRRKRPTAAEQSVTAPREIEQEQSLTDRPEIPVEQNEQPLTAPQDATVAQSEQPLTAPPEAPVVRTEYYVQAGAWKNPEYAEEMFAALKQLYPDAFMIEKNGFRVIRVPGIEDKDQGAVISEDIGARFHLKPILVKKQ